MCQSTAQIVSMTRKPVLRKNEPFWFDGGPLPFKLCFAANAEAWKIAIEQMKLDPEVEEYPSNSGRCTTFNVAVWSELTAVITINRRKGVSMDQIAGLIAHEMTHVAQQLARYMFPYDDLARLDAETEAYLIQWGTQNILSAFKER